MQGKQTLPRAKAAGDLDTTFGIDGVATLSVPGFDLRNAYGVISMPGDDTIFVSVTHRYLHEGEPTMGAAVVKLRPDGTIDDSFGMNGLTPIELEGEAKALQLHAWIDKILVHVAIGKTTVALARMHPDGSLDASFGRGGVSIVDTGDYEMLHADVVPSDDHIHIFGRRRHLTDGTIGSVVIRLLADGHPDAGLGDN